ncbi:MAG: hypothetical protein K2Q25_11900 [Mycobacteriaceae bacterium]|nr:hypothetical protein [Mycobacteriaceae bacterium]
MTTALAARLSNSMSTTTEIRRQRKALQRAQTVISIYKNNPDGSAGLLPVGRISQYETTKRQFPDRANVSSAGMFEIRATHWVAKFIASVPNNPNECKNIVIRVDKFGGKWRWTGLMHHWQVYTREGVDYLLASFNDDKQTIQFMLGRPNPLLPVNIFQFPRDWPQFGPSVWSLSVFLWLNLIAEQADEFVANLLQGLITLVADPFDIGQWANNQIAMLNPANWQMHIVCPSIINDSSLWTFIASRMNTCDSVIAAALDDAQLALTYRRVFTAEGEYGVDMFGNLVANGALMIEIVDRSQFSLPVGSYFSGTSSAGLVRSVLQWSDGFIEDTLSMITDDESLYADEYWQSGFLGTFAATPGVCIRDSWWNDLQSVVTYSPPTAAGVIVGGDNPTADAIAKLIISSVGNLVGYFLLGGFDSLGDIASDVIMPFLVGTIAAWDEWINIGRRTNLGWVHLFKVYQQGAENNAWSFAALAALRGGMNATSAQTCHTMVIDESTWPIPGVHCQIKDRIASSSGALQRMGIDMLFVGQIEEMNESAEDDGVSKFLMKIGKNEAAKTTGERTAQQLKFVLNKLSDLGVHLIS